MATVPGRPVEWWVRWRGPEAVDVDAAPMPAGPFGLAPAEELGMGVGALGPGALGAQWPWGTGPRRASWVLPSASRSPDCTPQPVGGAPSMLSPWGRGPGAAGALVAWALVARGLGGRGPGGTGPWGDRVLGRLDPPGAGTPRGRGPGRMGALAGALAGSGPAPWGRGPGLWAPWGGCARGATVGGGPGADGAPGVGASGARAPGDWGALAAGASGDLGG